jgi:divalent metal cation (Fe/Co/Zn/Cd) transporter
MNNDEVIEQLNIAIQELEKRRQEADELLDRKIKPEDFPDIEKRIIERVSSLTLRIHNLRTRRRNRELMVELDETIKPLPKARVEEMQEALEKISESIAATKNLQAALELAATISQSASDMFDATKPTTA